MTLGILDIHGRSNDPSPYSLQAGISWDQKGSTGWIAAEITYYVGQ